MRLRNGLRAAATVAVLLGGCVAVIASGDSNTATKVDGGSSGSGGTSASGGSTTFKVGDTVKLGDYTVVVNKVTDPFVSSNQFDKADAGSRYVAVDVSVTNNGSKPQTVSSFMCFSFKDSTGQKYSETFVSGAPDAPGGELAPGETVRGTIVIEAPTAATGLTMAFKCDLFSSGSATIALS